MSASPEAPPLLPPEVPPQAPPSTPKEKPQPAEKFLFSVGVKPNPKSPSPNKRKKAVSGKAVAVSPADFDSLNREATYERLRSLDKEALIEIIRQKDDMIAALLSVKSASDVERREDTKLVRASLDVVSSAVRSLKTTIEGRLSPAPSSSLAPSSVNSFPPLGTSSSFASTGSSAPLSPSRSLAQVAASAAALPLRPRSTRRNPADALRSAAHSLRSSAPAVSAARAQLQPDQFAIIAVEGFRRMEHSATKQHLSDMGVDVRHVHNVSNVGPILELVVTQSQRDNIVKAITQVPEGFRPDQCLHVKEDFDPSKPFHQDANAEVKERVLADFNSRMRRLQARASTFGWSGLGDFFAGRIDVPAARAARKIRKTGSTPDSGLAPADATMTDAPGPAVSAETAPEASGSSLATSPPALATSAAEAVAPTASGLQLQKFFTVRQWLSEGVDLVGVLESWYLHQDLYASDPSFLISSTSLPSSSPTSTSRKHDGVLLFASARVRDSVISVTRSSFFVRLVLPGLTIAFVYAPPRLTDADFLEVFRGLEDCDVVMGDFNVRLGPMLGASGSAAPLGRYHALALWMSAAGMCALPPSHSLHSATSRWDHVLVRQSLWDSLDSALNILDSAALGVDCDHPALHLLFPLEPAPDSTALPPDDGLSRMHLSRLHKPGAWQRLQDVYSAICPDVDRRLGLAEAVVRSEHLTEAERQGVIDAADAVLHEAVLAAGFGTLGQYDVQVARAQKDWTRARLEQSTSRFDAERLWRKSLRGKDRPMVASDAAQAAGKTVKEEASSFWSSAWGAADAPSQQPRDGCLPPGPVRADLDSLAAHFSLSAVEKAIQRYPRHKSGGEDGDHGLLLAALSFSQPSASSSPIPTSSLPPVLPSVGATRASARLQTPRIALNPRAAPFVPLAVRSPPPSTAQLPFPSQLARLFRLCASCRVVPRRWGRALVHLIPKQKTGLPTPQTSRPIAMLPMFRRLFESIFVRQLSADSQWARLHPAQCGFRKGWSCASALLSNHVASSSRPIAIYLDIENAFPSVRAEDELDVLRKRGAPLAVRQMSWALLTTGLCASLVVNKSRSAVIPVLRGLPQGAICSPTFFNFLIDELLVILNEGCSPDDPAAVFYADDGALLARSEKEAQVLLHRAEAWARSRGLRFNVRKCGVIAHSPISLTLNDQLLPQLPAYRYLGIDRTADGLDLHEYLTRKLSAMRAVLRRLRAVGGSWTPMARLVVFQTHCSSLLDFGGGLLHHFSVLPTSTIPSNDLTSLDAFFDEAACWIASLPANRRLLAHAMCGMVSGRVRLEHLALGLEQHLRTAHTSNPARALLRWPSPAHASPHSALLGSLRASPLSAAFNAARQHQQQAHPTWDPLSRRSFLRRERLQWLQVNTGTLGPRVSEFHRLRNLSDRLFLLSSAPLRLLATRWRSGTVFCNMLCVCGVRWTRGHIECLLNTFGFACPSSPPNSTNPGTISIESITTPALAALRRWAHGNEHLVTFNMVDFLLGHFRPDWHDLALNTLRYWLLSLSLHNHIPASSPLFSLLTLASDED